MYWKCIYITAYNIQYSMCTCITLQIDQIVLGDKMTEHTLTNGQYNYIINFHAIKFLRRFKFLQ